MFGRRGRQQREALRDSAPLTVARTSRYREWLRRYGLAECGGITGAIVGSLAIRRLTGNTIAAAYGGAWGEGVGYGGVIVARDLITGVRASRAADRRFAIRDMGRLAAGLLVEFGPAGLLDTLVTRPLAMAVGTRVLGLPFGIVVGKLMADVLFYLPVIFMYERKKQWRHDQRTRD